MTPHPSIRFAALAGFTIIELMMTLAILAILMGVAAPGLRDLVMNARMSGQANDLMTDLAMTRAEAVKRDSWTGLCASNNGTGCTNTAWDRGWIAFVDADSNGLPDNATPLLKVMPAFDNANTIAATGGAAQVVSFRSSGTLPAGSTGVTFTLCDPRRGGTHGDAATGKGRSITVSATGRAVSQPFTCP
jgi:type IV fimbrial biogenesis protein FimT